MMKRLHSILRIIAIVILAIAVGVPALLYVALSLPVVQRGICSQAETRLSALLDAEVAIDYISVTPFNRLTLHGVTICDSASQPAVAIDRLGSGISMSSLFLHGEVVVTYAEIIGLKADIHRATEGAPMNIQPIINALSPKDRNDKPKHFDFSVNTVVLRKSSVRYRVLDRINDSLRWNPADIHVTDIKADLHLPRISNECYDVDIRRLSAREHSGVYLTSLSGHMTLTDTMASINDLVVELPATRLALEPLSVAYESLSDLPMTWRSTPFAIGLTEECYLTPADFRAFTPLFERMTRRVDVEFMAAGTADSLTVHRFSAQMPRVAEVKVRGHIENAAVADSMHYSVDRMMVNVTSPSTLSDMVGEEMALSPEIVDLLAAAGHIDMEVSGGGSRSSGSATLSLQSDLTELYGKINYDGLNQSSKKIGGELQVKSWNGSLLSESRELKALSQLTALNASLAASAVIVADGRYGDGEATLNVERAEYRSTLYSDVDARIVRRGAVTRFAVESDDSDFDVELTGQLIEERRGAMAIDAHVVVNELNLAALGVRVAKPAHRLSAVAFVQLHGRDIDDMNGNIGIDNLRYVDDIGEGFRMAQLSLNSLATEGNRRIELKSDIADAVVGGRFGLKHIPEVARVMVSHVLPQIVNVPSLSAKHLTKMAESSDSLTFAITVKDTKPLNSLIKMPVTVIYPVDITGMLNGGKGKMALNVTAPYLQQGNKLIEETSLDVELHDATPQNPLATAKMYFTSMVPTKKGPMTMIATADAVDGRVDSRLQWNVKRDRRFSGDVNLSAEFKRKSQSQLAAIIHFNPGEMVFNDTVWTISPSVIDYDGAGALTVENFRIGRPGQFLTIDGRASVNEADTLAVELQNMSLDYVFETLNIANVTFGGIATGRFYATSLFTPSPRAFTQRLDVQGLSYNGCVLGNAVIGSEWNPHTKAIALHADIMGEAPEHLHSFIDGEIKPMADSLDLKFDVDRLPVGFLKPIMKAFATDVTGHAYGKARLFGSFKNVDMTGDLYADSVRVTIGFTNVTYLASDSVHLRPGAIQLNNLTLRDPSGHRAVLDGTLYHNYFKDARFDFRISGARDFLVYDVGDSGSDTWYGRIYGNGIATISGRPGIVDIGVEMATSANSTFTFVLSNELNAGEYNFITFRDRDQAAKDSIAALTAPPEAVRSLRERMNAVASGEVNTKVRLNFGIDVTPQAQMVLLMDPNGGDRIRAYGAGNMRLIYDTSDDNLRINGTYTVERGNYNFTLQDIIIKDFNIKEGSSITFHGDPMAAELNIEATYAVNANLSDLDESFLADKELNRTNVPVHALLKVDGDLRQPDISFDLEFPTLTQETYRKVRSIVNTDEMMNRQIIYLLALNRFYTPEYMNATRGNELVSVASSTISSQLGNMLGQLSDKWNIAPNFRSDKGDFSDVEVDVALSSHLLNNRLLLNGNLGYRDKALNTNSFVGDFDVEYLLNRSGTIRLKAYNRYNDRNFYVKSALTTQGVGIMFKRDFDDPLSFMRRWIKGRRTSAANTPVDSTAAPVDSVQKTTVP